LRSKRQPASKLHPSPRSCGTGGHRPLLLDFTEDTCYAIEVDDWRDRVDTVIGSARDSDACAMLLRPDCYVVWATDAPRPDQALRKSLRTALGTWFGAPS
jgi:hypothetical protein